MHDGGGQLLRNLVLFGRVLRAAGLKVTATQLADLAAALRYIDIGRRADFKAAARAMLTSRHEHQALFDALFERFWQRPPDPDAPRLGLEPPARKRGPRKALAHVLAGPEPDASERGAEEPSEPQVEKRFTYSAAEVLRHKDFAEMSAEELAEVWRLMRSMRWSPEPRRTRRTAAASRGAFLDLRRTLRRNLRHGGEPLRLAWRRRKLKKRPLVLLCDISGSMEPYSRVLLQFLYVAANSLGRAEAFAFGTRLTRLTRQLRGSDPDLALQEAAFAVRDWAGGTRIGEALKAFNFEWGRRVPSQGAVVLLVSDGWDRGDVELLEREVERLQRSCHRLIWLNPLLGSPGFEPLTRGLRAALPHVDQFLPVHNLKSLEDLSRALEAKGLRNR
jgi:hypothetical protein